VLSGAPEHALAESESTWVAPGGPGRIWIYLRAPVRSAGVSGRCACGFRTNLHCADVERTLGAPGSIAEQMRESQTKSVQWLGSDEYSFREL
jgi:hypothetical protein